MKLMLTAKALNSFGETSQKYFYIRTDFSSTMCASVKLNLPFYYCKDLLWSVHLVVYDGP